MPTKEEFDMAEKGQCSGTCIECELNMSRDINCPQYEGKTWFKNHADFVRAFRQRHDD